MTRWTLVCRSVFATRELAAAVASVAEPGDLVLLVGEMGAGKTAFAQGFAVGLGIDEPVTSPTFTLVRSYAGVLLMHHLDVYRLDRTSEVADLGLGELLDSGGVTLVEWADAIRSELPAEHLEVRLDFVDADADHRAVEVHASGSSWAARADALERALEPWRC